MIIQFMDHPSLNRKEQFLAILFYLGMATLEQMALLMGIEKDYAKTILRKIRDQESTKEEKDQWVTSIRSKLRGEGRMYKLGKKGLAAAAEIVQYEGPLFEISDFNWRHYRGTNDILIRLLKQLGRERLKEEVQWFNTRQASYELFRIWEWKRHKDWQQNPQLAKKERKMLSKPDALLIMNSQKIWIEWDNGTEREDQLEPKLKRYVQSFIPVGIKDLIIWVCPTPRRKEKLKALWEYRKSMLNHYPEMMFFSEGEETEFILSQVFDLVTR